MPADVMTIEQFIRSKYPEPKEDDPDFHFYQSWGYEQYLIKRYKHNLEQLFILERESYDQYRLGAMLDLTGKDNPLDALRGMSLVRAKGILGGFLMQSVAKGTIGVLLWEEENGDLFCLFPGRAGAFPALLRAFSPDDLDLLDQVFTTEEDVLSLQPTDRVSYVAHLKDRYVAIPDIGEVYVTQTWGGDYAGTYYTIQYVPAIPGKGVAWKRKPKAEKKSITIRRYQLEDARILS